MTLKLCTLDEIEDGDSNGFFAEYDGRVQGFIVVRRAEQVFVYLNSCPHIGTPLDFAPGQFLDLSKAFILCSSHGALFQIEDGLCISGPCADQSLTAVPHEVREAAIFLI